MKPASSGCVPVIEIGSGSLETTAIYDYNMQYFSASSGTTSYVYEGSSTPITTVDKAFRVFEGLGGTAMVRFRACIINPVSSVSEDAVRFLASSNLPAQSSGYRCVVEGYLPGATSFDRIRFYLTSGADSSVSTVDMSDGSFKVYGTNNLGYAVA